MWFVWLAVGAAVVSGGVTTVGAFCGVAWALTVLTVLGTVLTLSGLGWGVRRLTNEHRQIGSDLDAIANVAADHDSDSQGQQARMYAIRPPSSAWVDVLYLKEWIRRLVLEHAVQSLELPALLAVLGIVCAGVASVWSVWAA